SSVSKSEFEMINADYDEVRNSGPLPPVTIILISAAHAGSEMENSPGAIIEELHRRFVQNLTKAKLIKAQHSGHNVQSEDPSLVIDAIHEIQRLNRQGKSQFP